MALCPGEKGRRVTRRASFSQGQTSGGGCGSEFLAAHSRHQGTFPLSGKRLAASQVHPGHLLQLLDVDLLSPRDFTLLRTVSYSNCTLSVCPITNTCS